MGPPTEELPDALKRFKLERQSTPEQISVVLQEKILDGSLEPGERLREVQLAEAFGVSRNTLREALRVLEHEGLIRHVSHRGAEVTKLSAADVDDLFAARLALELAGARAALSSDRALSSLWAEVEGLEKAGDAADTSALLDHDLAFHRLLVAQLGSPRLDAFYLSLQRELRLVLSHLDAFDPLPQVADHRPILEAVSAGRAEEADERLAEHLRTSRRRVAELVSAQS